MRSCYLLGMERTGLSWLAQEMSKSDHLYVTQEKEPQFRLANLIARHPEDIVKYYLDLTDAIRAERVHVSRRSGGIHVDRNPALLWIAHLIATKFPDVRFVGVKRRVYSVVFSMRMRPTTMQFREDAPLETYSVPSRVDGINAAIWGRYPNLTTEARHTLVWLSHMQKLDAFQEEMGDRMLLLQYERLVLQPDQEFGRLWAFLGVEGHVPEVERIHLDKWMDHLTPEQVGSIWDVVSNDFYKTEIDRMIQEDRARGW